MSAGFRVWWPGRTSRVVSKVERVHEFHGAKGSKNILDTA
jgi:hypothetical protein